MGCSEPKGGQNWLWGGSFRGHFRVLFSFNNKYGGVQQLVCGMAEIKNKNKYTAFLVCKKFVIVSTCTQISLTCIIEATVYD